jgi:hypothetical protein
MCSGLGDDSAALAAFTYSVQEALEEITKLVPERTGRNSVRVAAK